MYAKDGTLLDRREMLRVKLKNLAQESKLIRREEQRARAGQLRDELALHRRGIVRTAARDTHLAYGFIKGRALIQMEHNCEHKDWSRPNWDAITKMVKRYGPVTGGCPALEAAISGKRAA